MSQNQFEYYYKNIMYYHMGCKMPITNIMEIPKIDKIVVNIGFPNISQDKKLILSGLFALEMLTHQKAFPTKTKKQVLTLKISQNTFVGSTLTLRNKNMITFMNQVVSNIFKPGNRKINLSYKTLPEDHAITFSLYDFLFLPAFDKESHFFRHLPKLNFTIVFSSKESFWSFENMITFILQSFHLPSKLENEDDILTIS